MLVEISAVEGNRLAVLTMSKLPVQRLQDSDFEDFEAIQTRRTFKNPNQKPVYAAETRVTKVNIQNAQNVVHRGVLNVSVDGSGQSKKTFIKPAKPATTSQERPTQNHLMDIKDRVGPDWKDMGRRLEFDDAVLEQWKLDNHPHPLDELIYQILRKWMQRENEKATRERLAKVFLKLNRGDLADILAEDD
ncbi:Receptor-interacting serine/threonine-protein kinase 1 [Bulinus truncatus]|nr:Receptor-interacting serine/threonine-protein kinase 1 [Bulinus truncatus]